ncbi:unnamed protein product [Eruca vesicaria subsp. sativa]|uniref:Uncharacterized protein n=1 Tax=Eruca vesicaria subsp. sativa TaxID=29727 RepID=A0ABC8INV6_ERUVS|nr:unnamed protein product [Eruca vesicaria subsp. sativa]
MAASSPSLTNNGLSAAVTPPANLRGRNKPKCIQCGNTARSRCPFESCKGCCSRAENPCPIHVLKGVATSAEKTAPSTPSSEHKASEGTPGSTTRVSSSIRHNFAQFNNLNAAARKRKPLTIKDAQALNEWRFTKLKEYRDRNIEVENEAFDRYMSNVNLLEEVFSLASVPEEHPGAAASEQNSWERTVSELKLRLRSNSARTESFKKRITETVKAGFVKLHKRGGKSDCQDEIKRLIKRRKWEEKTSALNELIDKLNKARTEEDLKSCIEMKTKLYGQASCSSASEQNRIFPAYVRTVDVSEEAFQETGEQLRSFDQIITL